MSLKPRIACWTPIVAIAVAWVLMAEGAPASTFGLAKSDHPFRIERASGAILVNAPEGAIVEMGDRLLAGPEPVLIQSPEGDTVLVGRNSRVSFRSEHVLELEGGELAVANADDRDIEVGYQDLRFYPVSSRQRPEVPAQLALRAEENGHVQAISLNRMLGAAQTQDEPVQVAVLGNADVVRFLRSDSGRWVALQIADAGAQSDVATDAGASSAAASGGGCGCVSELRPTELGGGLAPFAVESGRVEFADGKAVAVLPPEAPTAAPAFVVEKGEAPCGGKVEVPATVYGAVNLTEFRFTLIYNDLCARLDGVKSGSLTEGWKIKVEEPRDGVAVITAEQDKGNAVTGTGEVLILVWKQAKGCPCESPLTLVDLKGGLAAATPVEGMARCRLSAAPDPDVPAPPPSGFTVRAAYAESPCTKLTVPILVQGAPGLQEFEFTLLYNDNCMTYSSVDEGGSTQGWDIEADEPEAGRLVIKGRMVDDGLPVVGDGEIAQVHFRCARAIPLLIPWPCVIGGAAGAAAGAAIVWWIDDDDSKKTSSPRGPISPVTAPAP